MNRRVWTLVLAAGAIAAAVGCGGGSGGDAGQLASAREAVTLFGGELKQALLEGLSDGGPAPAVTVCRDLAPEIAGRIGGQTGWELSRTSLKVRNPANAPDPWERGVLDRFAAQKAAGQNPTELEFHQVVEEDGRRVFRYMKAIPTGQICLQCHGSQVFLETQVNIQEYYPEDQATGFALGDIRGAFSARRPL